MATGVHGTAGRLAPNRVVGVNRLVQETVLYWRANPAVSEVDLKPDSATSSDVQVIKLYILNKKN